MTFDHLGIIVRSLLDGRNFFEATAAYKSWSAVFEDEALGVRVQFGRQASGPTIELIQPLGKNSPIAATLQRGVNTLNHLAYRVENLEVSAKTLRLSGCIPLSPPAPALAYGGALVQFFYSPQKLLLELIRVDSNFSVWGGGNP